jgi:hypothetical protein
MVTLALDAGVSLRDVQDAARHADPRTTRRYDRARHALDRHATYTLAAFVAEVAPSPTGENPLSAFRFLLEVDDFRSRLRQDAGGQVVQIPTQRSDLSPTHDGGQTRRWRLIMSILAIQTMR